MWSLKRKTRGEYSPQKRRSSAHKGSAARDPQNSKARVWSLKRETRGEYSPPKRRSSAHKGSKARDQQNPKAHMWSLKRETRGEYSPQKRRSSDHTANAARQHVAARDKARCYILADLLIRLTFSNLSYNIKV